MEHQAVIKKGSKSFALASLFLSRKEKEASWKLYSWCRYCDDLIDEVSDQPIMRERLTHLKLETMNLSRQNSSNFYLSAMFDVLHDFKLPMKYPMDLLLGMEMDVEGRRFNTLAELEVYCYCVAGVVGLMMCHILGIRHEFALKHAVAMGKAMQLTNICRDIKEDHENGRLYLPLEWLKEKGVSEEDLFLEKNFEHLITFQKRLLLRADELYGEGLQGLKYLTLRSSWAVLIAAMIYAEIGQEIRKDHRLSLKRRSYVSGGRKIGIVIQSLKKMIPLVLSALFAPKVQSPQSVWSMDS